MLAPKPIDKNKLWQLVGHDLAHQLVECFGRMENTSSLNLMPEKYRHLIKKEHKVNQFGTYVFQSLSLIPFLSHVIFFLWTEGPFNYVVYEIEPKDGGLMIQFDDEKKRISTLKELMSLGQIKEDKLVDIDSHLPQNKLNTNHIDKLELTQEQVKKLEAGVKPELAAELMELNGLIKTAVTEAKSQYYTAMAGMINTLNKLVCENKTSFFGQWPLKEGTGMAAVVLLPPKTLTPEKMHSILGNLKQSSPKGFSVRSHWYGRLDSKDSDNSVVLYIKLQK